MFDQTNCIFMTTKVKAFKPQQITEMYLFIWTEIFGRFLGETIS